MKRVRFETPLEAVEKEMLQSLPALTGAEISISSTLKDSDNKKMKTGTTALAVLYKEGVVLAADRQTTYGHLVADDHTRKIYEISDCSALAAAGAVSFIQWTVQIVKRSLLHFAVENDEMTMPLKVQAETLRSIMRFLMLRGLDIYSEFIFAGFDHVDEVPRIFKADSWGGLYPEAKYSVTGSGMDFALAILDRHLKNTKSAPDHLEAMEIAIEAVKASGARDIYTGTMTMTSYPLVITVNKQGVLENVFGPAIIDPKKILAELAPDKKEDATAAPPPDPQAGDPGTDKGGAR